MPVSRKRKIEKKDEQQKHMNVGESAFGKVLITILCAAMIAGIVFAAFYLIFTSF